MVVLRAALRLKKRRCVKRRMEQSNAAARVVPFTTQRSQGRRKRWFSHISMHLGRRASADKLPRYSAGTESIPPRYSAGEEVSNVSVAVEVPPYSAVSPDEKVDRG